MLAEFVGGRLLGLFPLQLFGNCIAHEFRERGAVRVDAGSEIGLDIGRQSHGDRHSGQSCITIGNTTLIRVCHAAWRSGCAECGLGNGPIGEVATEKPPGKFVEVRLMADRFRPGRVGLYSAHGVRARSRGNAARHGLVAKRRALLREPHSHRGRGRAGAPRSGRSRKHAGDGL